MQINIRKYLPFYKHNLSIAIPIMLANAGQVMVMQVDNMMVGQVGTTELSASSFANAMYFVFMVFALGLTLGITPLVGERWTKNKFKETSKLLSNSVFVSIIASIIIVALMYLSSLFFDYFGQSPDVIKLGRPYFYILMLSLVPYIIFSALKQFMEGVGSTKYAMIITLASNVINVILNYFFIFDKTSVESTFIFDTLGIDGLGLGLNGAGYATLISRIFMPIAFVVYLLAHRHYKRYVHMAMVFKPEKRLIREIRQMGLPISVQMLLEVSIFNLSAIMAGWISEEAQAAHQIALGITSLTYMLAAGISSATTIRVSHQHSEKNYHNMNMASMASIHMVVVYMTITALLYLVFRNYIPMLYNDNAEVVKIASLMLICAGIFQIFDGLQIVLLGILRGMGDVAYAMRVAFIAYFIFGPPVGYLFAFTFDLGAMGIWVGLIVSLAVASILFMKRYIHIYRKLAQTAG
ncbi:MAG: MATE family efflux transporter [Bacteroidales bacterium]